jgi:hypothetical protein
MKIDPVFFEVFAAWFNVDVIDLNHTKQLQKDADGCASTLSQRIDDLTPLISDLSQFLQEWDATVVLKLIEVTNTDWFFDAQTEDALKYIITEIIEGMKFYRRSRFQIASQHPFPQHERGRIGD